MPLVGIHLANTEMPSIIARAEHVLSRYVAADASIRFHSPAHIAAATNANQAADAARLLTSGSAAIAG